MGRFPSGQRGQTVNLLAPPSKVRILLCPLSRCGGTGRRAGLKILLWQHSTGSIPVTGMKEISFIWYLFLHEYSSSLLDTKNIHLYIICLSIIHWHIFCNVVQYHLLLIWYVRVAQLDRASGYGPEGRGFESFHAHFKDFWFFSKVFFLYNKKFLSIMF